MCILGKLLAEYLIRLNMTRFRSILKKSFLKFGWPINLGRAHFELTRYSRDFPYFKRFSYYKLKNDLLCILGKLLAEYLIRLNMTRFRSMLKKSSLKFGWLINLGRAHFELTRYSRDFPYFKQFSYYKLLLWIKYFCCISVNIF